MRKNIYTYNYIITNRIKEFLKFDVESYTAVNYGLHQVVINSKACKLSHTTYLNTLNTY